MGPFAELLSEPVGGRGCVQDDGRAVFSEVVEEVCGGVAGW